ncbi:DUF4382 domain-containing protein [Mesoterricola sediminis]|uniref:DUF4382 domain-containing protein n=1 Tax=Mesoterricola sediminis TaxID=2927980 RepID=A0AA48GT49_9BACT|nr:DUF4382 domain-containing protein [Mesoterricola sediminis]BDU77214.1 hypothetical protein METESE_21720 [Mesoterricola sediminis]
MRKLIILPAAAALAGFLGCTSNSGSSSSGTLSVHMVDGPTSAYKSVLLDVTSIEISKDGGSWTTLGTWTGGPIDLLTLTGGISQTLAQGVTLSSGVYGQMRLHLGTNNSVVLQDGSSHALTVPSGLQTGLKLVGNFNVQAGTTADIWIDFDAAHSIQVVGAGNSGKYMLRPVVFCYDKAVTGSVSGTLTDAADNSALAGVTVYAETLDNAGNASVVRSTVTDASGKYTLDLLPVGGTYFVVTMPATATKVYSPKASAATPITVAAPVATYSAAFTASLVSGTAGGTVTPLATTDQSDAAYLLATFASGGSTANFIVRRDVAAVGATETFNFGTVPAAAYFVTGVRATTASDGTVTRVVSNPAIVPLVVPDGGAGTAALAF